MEYEKEGHEHNERIEEELTVPLQIELHDAEAVDKKEDHVELCSKRAAAFCHRGTDWDSEQRYAQTSLVDTKISEKVAE